MFGYKRRHHQRQLAIKDFEAQKQITLEEAQEAVASLAGITGIEIAKRSRPDRMGIGAPLIHVATWCLVIHAAHPHCAGMATAAMPDRMYGFPVCVESDAQFPSRIGSAFGALMGWVRGRA